MASFETKVIAITGGASGMGLAVADYLVRRGARVSISDVQEKALNQAAATLEQVASLGASAVLAQIVDVRSVDQVDTWIKQTKRTFGQLDGAVNMAGVAGKAGKHPLVDQEEDDWELVIGINLTGLMHCLRAELRVLTTPGGSIVNVSSTAGLKGTALTGAYTASKHGVIGLTKSTAQEVGHQGTRVNCIAPGPINTPMISVSAIPHDLVRNMTAMKRMGEPEEVAALVAFLLGDESKYITGSVYAIDGGLGI